MASTATPMMAQYMALKREAGDCLLFYRMGDFFELFFEDARTAAQVLDIALTSRGEHDGAPVPMCGVPVHAAEGYLARLIKAGCRVAIAEQTETPDEAKQRAKREGTPSSKALVSRDIVRFVTAGTLTEEALLEPRRANMLAAVCEVRGTCGVAACDISTGRMELEECEAGQLGAVLARIGASETVAPEDWDGAPADYIPRPGREFASDEGEARLKKIHGVATLDGFGRFGRAMLAAAGGLVAYLDHAGRGTLPLLLPPVVRESCGALAMDEATRTSLEILESSTGGRAGSLVAAIDRCVTGAGARQLAEDLAAPLTDKARIDARLSLVQFFHADPLLRADLREVLRALPDVGRALGRVVAGRGSPRDLGQLRDGLNEARRVRDHLLARADRPALLDTLLPQLGGHGALTDLLGRALVPAPPSERSQGGFIAEGYDASLDELRKVSGNARRAIAALEAKYRDETGIAALKIKHNGVLGYFIEVPARHGDALMAPDSGFTHRQTMAGAVRFNSLHLHEEASRIAEAGGHALAAEEAHFEELVAAVGQSARAIAETAAALARIDVAAGQAERAAIGLVDRLFSRVGARDNLARGRSTFMVEMVETAAILAQATEASFVILDEVGRGTSTYDGLALAWAVVEAVHETNRCRCLFATHYHELSRLAETCDALSLHHVRAREWKGDLVLLHELAEGPADRSYGLAVAKLAGVPKEVVARAKSVLDRLEKGRAQTGGLAAGLGDLPLFAAAMEAEEDQCDELRERLRELDLDALSPREALDLLYELKRQAAD